MIMFTNDKQNDGEMVRQFKRGIFLPMYKRFNKILRVF